MAAAAAPAARIAATAVHRKDDPDEMGDESSSLSESDSSSSSSDDGEVAQTFTLDELLAMDKADNKKYHAGRSDIHQVRKDDSHSCIAVWHNVFLTSCLLSNLMHRLLRINPRTNRLIHPRTNRLNHHSRRRLS